MWSSLAFAFTSTKNQNYRSNGTSLLRTMIVLVFHKLHRRLCLLQDLIKDLYKYLHLVSIIPNRLMLAAFNISLRNFRDWNCARKILMPLTLTCLELYSSNANIYTGLLNLLLGHLFYVFSIVFYLNFLYQVLK